MFLEHKSKDAIINNKVKLVKIDNKFFFNFLRLQLCVLNLSMHSSKLSGYILNDEMIFLMKRLPSNLT